MKTILATIALMAGQAAATQPTQDHHITNVMNIGNPGGSPWTGYYTPTNYALKPETCADGSAATKVIYRSIYDQVRAATTDAQKQAALTECYNTADTWCQGEAKCTRLYGGSETLWNLKPLTSSLVSDYVTNYKDTTANGGGIVSSTPDADTLLGCVAVRPYNPTTHSSTGVYRVYLNQKQWSTNKNVGYESTGGLLKTFGGIDRLIFSMDREYVKRTCPIVARQFRRFEAFKDYDIVETNPGDSIGSKMAYNRIYNPGGVEHQMGCVIRPIGNSQIWYINSGGSRVEDTGYANSIVWGFQWKNDGKVRNTQAWCSGVSTENYCGLISPQMLSQAHEDGKYDADQSKQFTTEDMNAGLANGYKTFYPFNSENDLTTGVMIKRGWFTIPIRGSGGYLGCEGDAADHTSVAASKAYCSVSTPGFFTLGNPDIAGQSPNPKKLYPDFGCDTCTNITGSVANSFTCTSKTNSVFNTPVLPSQCTSSDDAPFTATVPHTCGEMGNDCPAGFKQKNHQCENCAHARTNSSFINTATCSDDSGCACMFDPGFKSSKSTPAKYETAAGGRSGMCKFKSMNDLFEYGYSAYEDPLVEQGIITQIENITGSSVEEFVKQDYLLRKATIRVSLKNYDANVDGGGVKGYKYYNFAKTAADGEVWNDFVTAAPADKTGKIQDVGTICWIKPASTNDCIFDSSSSCDRTLTKAEYMTENHNITANGATILTDDCDIIQFVEPLISTRVMSDDIPDTWESDLDITSNGVDIIGTIIRGFVTDGTSHVMKDEVETKIAMHKLIGISSECIDSNADTHGRTTGNAENIFAWGDLQAKVKFNMVAKVELLRSEKGDPTDYIGAFQSGSASAVNDPTQMFDLLFVSGENVFNMPNTDLDEQTGLISFAALTNGPQSSFNQLLIEHTGFDCGTTLTITTSGGDFDCFGDGSDATGDSAQTQTGAYFRTTLDSADYGHEWILQTNESDAAYASPVDFINSLAITGADNLHATQPCTAEIQHTCGQRIMKVTDNRKCFNFHGMTADTNPVDEFQNLNTTNNAGEYNLLNVTSGACQKPKNAATEVQSSMNIETIVLERLRLSVERILPVTERPINGGYSALQTSAAGGYISANYATQIGNDWDCDTTACNTDPYHVLYYKNEGVSDFACDWRTGHVGENDAKTDSVWSDGDDFFLTGCTDNATSLVSDCQVPLKGLGVCDAFSPPSSVTPLFMPPASFPHFYVYAMSTYTASFPQTQSLSNVEQTSTTTSANKVGQTRRLGSKKLLASKSTSQSFSKSMFVISDTHHL